MQGVNRLRTVREARGLSQRKVAEQLGVSAATVNRHEQGTRGIDKATADEYSKLYQVEVVELFSPILVVSGDVLCQPTTIAN